MAAGRTVDERSEQAQGKKGRHHVHHKKAGHQHHLVVIRVRPRHSSWQGIVQDEADLQAKGEKITISDDISE